MIFGTVGGQVPFDRLVGALDRWAQERSGTELFLQVGDSDIETRARSERFLSPAEYREHFARARAVVAHAGMGTILTALTTAKPLVIFPRRASLGEHRNEHQLATARHFQDRPGILVAMDEDELLDHLEGLEDLEPPERISDSASPELLAAVREFLHSPTRR